MKKNKKDKKLHNVKKAIIKSKAPDIFLKSASIGAVLFLSFGLTKGTYDWIKSATLNSKENVSNIQYVYNYNVSKENSFNRTRLSDLQVVNLMVNSYLSGKMGVELQPLTAKKFISPLDIAQLEETEGFQFKILGLNGYDKGQYPATYSKEYTDFMKEKAFLTNQLLQTPEYSIVLNSILSNAGYESVEHFRRENHSNLSSYAETNALICSVFASIGYLSIVSIGGEKVYDAGKKHLSGMKWRASLEETEKVV